MLTGLARRSILLFLVFGLGACSDTTGPEPGEHSPPPSEPPAVNDAVQRLTASDASPGDNFGAAVAIDGDVAVVGADGNDEFGVNAGAAYVFERSGESWSQVARLSAIEPEAEHRFGQSVAVDGEVAVVGEPLGHPDNDSQFGVVYVFERSGGAWSESARLDARDGTIGDLGSFGASVAVSGDVIVVGAWGDDAHASLSGAAYVFERAGDRWEQTAKLVPGDGAFEDFFGESVTVDGDVVVVGASQDDDNGENSGSAYVFERSGDTWTQATKLTASDGTARDHFGFSVALSGDAVVVGARFDQAMGTQTGSAYVFERSGESWSEIAKLAASDAAAGDRFGEAVALSGTVAVIGATEAGAPGSHPGSAYVFERSGGSWSEIAKLLPPEEFFVAPFGRSVAVDGDTIFVGASQSEHQATKPGAVHVFDISSL